MSTCGRFDPWAALRAACLAAALVAGTSTALSQPRGEEPLCAPDADGRRLGFPLAGRSDAAGILSSSDGSIFELACTSGAQGKCARFGYAPWRQAPDGRPMISTTISADTGRMLPIHA